jgi:hypothetical protein
VTRALEWARPYAMPQWLGADAWATKTSPPMGRMRDTGVADVQWDASTSRGDAPPSGRKMCDGTAGLSRNHTVGKPHGRAVMRMPSGGRGMCETVAHFLR